ncbi:hypothetical protein OPT61_g8773 [Boeremia exigua]|uniref:Uncharacterized protein n=1 Tax=Boeremia exigua TaxID=749465 RepID=A0ACC2HXM6_9PLEO|nr:hypothetical protein OPT61_g8773 [Boeremia exigua]
MSRTNFRHAPLDHSKASIRLLRMSPDLSSDGLVQCTITHATVEPASYDCLSYMWGPPLPSYDILINGGIYSVGPNLFSFLDVFRRRPDTLKYLWIDAICIAQGDVLERNHQVSQMGEIYSVAQIVYIWLGRHPSMAAIGRSLKNWQNATYEDIGLARSDLLKQYLYDNEYWNRAWITQEFVLAREIILFLDNEALGMTTLSSAMGSFYLLTDEALTTSVFYRHFSPKYIDIGSVTEQPLISLLDRFRDKKCSIPADRIHSLLSLCSRSSKIEVRYERTPLSLVQEILARHTQSVCLCDIMLVLRSLDLARDPSAAPDAEGKSEREWEGTVFEIDMFGIQLKYLPEGSGAFFECFHPYTDSICPLVREVIAYAVRNTILTSNNSVPVQLQSNEIDHIKVPYMYQGLHKEDAQRLILASGEEWKITASKEDPKAYTIRLPMESVARMPLQSTGLCCKAQTRLAWVFPSSVLAESQGRQGDRLRVFKRAWDQYHNAFAWDEPHYHLAKNISFLECYFTYAMLLDSEDKPRGWIPWSYDSIYNDFFSDLKNYLNGLEKHTSRLERTLREARHSLRQPEDCNFALFVGIRTPALAGARRSRRILEQSLKTSNAATKTLTTRSPKGRRLAPSTNATPQPEAPGQSIVPIPKTIQQRCTKANASKQQTLEHYNIE